MKKLFLSFFVLINLNTNAFAEEAHFPEGLLLMDSYFNHHVIVAEKSTHKLYLYTQENGYPKRIKEIQMATGKKAGNKIFQGDHRTPEGVYHFNQFLTHQDLIKRHGKEGNIYGVGAFVMNYPNPIDQILGKTGGGIWLHSTNDETRIEKGLDSRGCVVTANTNLIDLSQYIELNKTAIVVTHEMKYLSREAWLQKRKKLMNTVLTWVEAWRNEDIKDYLKAYHPELFVDPARGSFKEFSQYKRSVFWGPGKPKIELDYISILISNNYATVTFKQYYESKTIQDVGKKTLYLKQDGFYDWKIVSERWTKDGLEKPLEMNDDKMAFRPSNRFFETDDPSRILNFNYRGKN